MNGKDHKEILFHTPQVAILKETDNKYWQACGIGTLAHCWRECKMVQPLWEKAWQSFKDLNIELSYGPAISLLAMYIPKRNETYVHT